MVRQLATIERSKATNIQQCALLEQLVAATVLAIEVFSEPHAELVLDLVMGVGV